MTNDDVFDSETLDRQTSQLGEMRTAFADLSTLSQSFGQALSASLSSAIARGRDLGDVLRTLALRMSSMVLSRAMKPLEQQMGQAFGGLASGLLGGLNVKPFAKGGIVGAPALFGMGGNQLGLMGEAGPEAILPLSRGSDGRLGIQSGSQQPVQVTVNISTPDAPSFQASQRQISTALARAVHRGTRGV
jgi:phage-related minor tail protein